MAHFLEQLVNAVTLGAIYGLIAIGYTMVYGIIGMVNFAHGDVFMMSSFIALIFYLVLTQILGITSIALALLIVLVLGMVMTGLWNWMIERVAYKPLRGSFRLAPLISAIGMSILLVNLMQVIQGPTNKSIPALVTGILTFGPTGGIVVAWKQILIVGVTGGLLAVFWYLVQRTPLGRAQRACEQDRRWRRSSASTSTARSRSPSSSVRRSPPSPAPCT